jgi:DNA-binding transcriptional LysR family regulator
MDITLARTFLIVVETGSFVEAARKMHVTQSTVSARIKGLEDLLGRSLFERSKSGASLTAAGEQFQKHALALIRVWQHAQLEARLSEQRHRHISIGAPAVLWAGLLLDWVARLRSERSDTAISANAGLAPDLTQRLLEGTLDLAVMYRPMQPPGMLVEHLFDEELVLVASARSTRARPGRDYVFIDWGPDFQIDHATALPGGANAGLNLDLGSFAIDFLLANEASCYVPYRLVRQHLARGRLKLNRRARKFVYPVYMVYPEERDEEAFEPILDSLRRKTQARA